MAAESATSAASSGVKRIALVAASQRSLLDLHASLLSNIVSQRHKVLCLTPDLTPADQITFGKLGVAADALPLHMNSLNPFADFLLRRQWSAALKAYAPHTLVTLDLEASALVAPIAARVGVPNVVAMIERIPASIGDTSLVEATPSTDARAQLNLRKTMAAVNAVVLPTLEDQRSLVASEWLRPDTSIHVTAGAGIDLSKTLKQPLPPLDQGFAFLLSQPVLSAAAVSTFLAAAQVIKAKSGLARFRICGDLPSGPDRTTVVDAIKGSPFLIQHAPASDVTAMTTAAHVVVHASDTGLTSHLLTALAIGRPILAADVPGSRDAVDEIVNGCLFVPGDATSLAEAMQSLLRRADLLVAMGHASRLKAERRFDARDVTRVMLHAFGLDDGRAAAA